MKPAEQDQHVEDLKQQYPAASQAPAAMMKAREVIRRKFGSVCPNRHPQFIDGLAEDLVEQLTAAGFVILPREPDEGMLLQACNDHFSNWSRVAVFTGDFYRLIYRAMVQHYESKGEAE